MASITAKQFTAYIEDEFDVEVLDLLIGVIEKRKQFIAKMQDIGNPRAVVKGYQMNKQDLKEFYNKGKLLSLIPKYMSKDTPDYNNNRRFIKDKVNKENPQNLEDFLMIVKLHMNNNDFMNYKKMATSTSIGEGALDMFKSKKRIPAPFKKDGNHYYFKNPAFPKGEMLFFYGGKDIPGKFHRKAAFAYQYSEDSGDKKLAIDFLNKYKVPYEEHNTSPNDHPNWKDMLVFDAKYVIPNPLLESIDEGAFNSQQFELLRRKISGRYGKRFDVTKSEQFITIDVGDFDINIVSDALHDMVFVEVDSDNPRKSKEYGMRDYDKIFKVIDTWLKAYGVININRVFEGAQIKKPISTLAELEQLKKDIEKTGLASHIGIETKRAHDNGGLINLYVDYEDPKHGTQELSIYLDLQGGGNTFNVRSEDGWSTDNPVDTINKILSKKSILESSKRPTKRRKIMEAMSQPLGSEVVSMLHEIASNYKVKVPANKSWNSVANMVESVYLSIAKKDRASFIQDISKLKRYTNNGEIIL
tara:strand:+ start:207 stop:1790 length:1584 start_codon:yes stop_codon:yes gene_type:complete